MAAKQKEVDELEGEMSRPDFWSKREEADAKIRTLGELRDTINDYTAIETGIASLKKSFSENLFYEIKRRFRELELENLFNGLYDKQNAILSVYPGAGGDDAEDWGKMLFEMYLAYASGRKWPVAVIDDNPRSKAMEIKGKYAYGYLKHEAGVHRLVRISPFSAKKLRHTSFALVEIVPAIPLIEESKMQIPEKDLKFEFYRSGGPGGQNVNKVETAVRVIHIPTGLTASSQAERSQAQNREYAVKLLKAKIFHLMRKHQVEELSGLRLKVKPEWGQQIRSYVLNPYQLVKDNRTEVATSQVDKVLAGELDRFIEAEIERL